VKDLKESEKRIKLF